MLSVAHLGRALEQLCAIHQCQVGCGAQVHLHKIGAYKPHVILIKERPKNILCPNWVNSPDTTARHLGPVSLALVCESLQHLRPENARRPCRSSRGANSLGQACVAYELLLSLLGFEPGNIFRWCTYVARHGNVRITSYCGGPDPRWRRMEHTGPCPGHRTLHAKGCRACIYAYKAKARTLRSEHRLAGGRRPIPTPSESKRRGAKRKPCVEPMAKDTTQIRLQP